MTHDKITTIRMHESTKKLLAERGSKGDSYEEIIIGLIEKWSDDLNNPPSFKTINNTVI